MANEFTRHRASRWREIFELTRVRVYLFLREPEAVFWVIFFPIILAFVLSFAFRKGDLEPSRVALLGDPSSIDVLVATISNDKEESMVEPLRELDESEARARLRRGSIDAILTLGDRKELIYDPDRAEGVLGRDRLLRQLGGKVELTPELELEQTPIDRSGTRYIDFLFPGLLGMNLMGTGIWSIAFAIADMRQKRLLKRFLVTPMRRSSFLLSFAGSRLVFLIVEISVLIAFGLFVLNVPFLGSAIAFLALTIVASLTFAGLGLLAASRTQSIEGVSGIINLIMMPMWLCSGIFFAYERFPEFLHPVIRLIPLTAVNDGLRAVMLDGAGLAQVYSQLLVMSVWAVFSFFVSLKVFRWT